MRRALEAGTKIAARAVGYEMGFDPYQLSGNVKENIDRLPG